MQQTQQYTIIFNDFYGIELPFIYDEYNVVWMPIKETCKMIHLTKSQTQTELRKFNTDMALKNISKTIKILSQTGQRRNIKCMKEQYFFLWLMKLDYLSISEETYCIMSNIINKASDYEIYKPNRQDYYKDINIFHKEKMLQEYIFNNKQLLDIKILKQEVKYEFGRIDFLGIDRENNKVCVELKRKTEFEDTKEQLLRYKHFGEFNRLVFVANDISKDFREFLIENNIEYIKYEIDNYNNVRFLKEI